MSRRLSLLFPLALLLIVPATAKDKKKSQIPEYILRAQSVRVVIDPEAGEPLYQPNANATARENVEKALTEWGRYRVVALDGEDADIVIAIHTGDDRMVRPTIKGGPIDQRPGIAQGSPGNVRIGGQGGQPTMNDPTMDPQNPQNQAPRMGQEVGPRQDSFMVYSGRTVDPTNSPALWRYTAKGCLNAPEVKAVEEFRKAIAEAEKPTVPKKP
ncbi:MAG TPA: hypothetical protein VMG82_22520 [Candidatus Sulfotelmatobacter sp.]|nr:hypothetical protein [Candidatus Sulfotelmatobacter sp.]